MRKIVIAPYQMHANLLKKYRQKDPFSDVKIISKEGLMSEYYGLVDEKATAYLMKKYHYSYDNVSIVLSFIPFINKPINNLLKIKEDLIENHLISKNIYLSQFFKGNLVFVHGYSDSDKEIKNILNDLKVNYQFVKNEKKELAYFVDTYETQFDEVFYVLNAIAELLDKGEDINRIYIYSVDSEYLYPFSEFSQSFGFKVDDGKANSLYVTPLASRFLKQYIETKDIDAAKEAISDCENKELLEDLLSVIDRCLEPEMDFETQLDYLIGELKSTKVSKQQFKDVVRVINKPIYEQGAHIFVVGFAQGFYPASKKDSELLSDLEKASIGLNTSLEETKNNQDVLLDFFNSDNHFHFSFSERSISNKKYLSPLVKMLGFKERKPDLPKVIYSQDMVNYFYARMRDLKEFYKQSDYYYQAIEKIANIHYGEYDNSFTGVDAMNEDMEIKHSYSKINEYYQCPFKYYVSNILSIDPFEGNFATKFGTVAHKIFELHNDEGFDFDKVFDEEVKKQGFSDEELPLVENLRMQIKRASESIRLHQHYMNNPKIITEKRLKMQVGKKSFLSGVIDKSIIFDDKYLVLVDYKTGSDSFDSKYINEGVSLQLPTYCLLAINDDEFKKYEIIGTFINNVVDSKLSYGNESEALIDPFFKLHGKVATDLELISQIDKTICDGKSEFIKSVSLSKDGGFKKSDSLVSKDEFNNYAEVALRKYLEADANIRKNNFSINPLFKSKSDNACKYCEYKDLCFVKKAQRRYLYNPAEDEKEEEDNE